MNISNAAIDELIASGEGKVLRSGIGVPDAEPEAQQPGILAVFGGMNGSQVLPESTITIAGTVYPIPKRTRRGLRLAPARICEAIRDAGYRPVPADYYSAFVDGGSGIRVEPITSG